MAAQDETVLEAEKQVLADRLHSEQAAAVEPARDPGQARARMRRLDLESLADEGLEPLGHAMDRVALGHKVKRMHQRLRAAAAGSAGTLVWSALEPVDRRLFRNDYSDVAVLGKAFTRGRGWRPLGLSIHAVNGAIFGLVYEEIARRSSRNRRRLALELALAEHLVLFSTGKLVDLYHPARGEQGVKRLFSARAFAQATLRHALFGLVLGSGTKDGPTRAG